MLPKVLKFLATLVVSVMIMVGLVVISNLITEPMSLGWGVMIVILGYCAGWGIGALKA